MHPGRMAEVPDPEVPERPRRRRFTAAYKLAILDQLDQATQPGAKGAILRREGLYTSHIVEWRRARDAGALEALGRPRGPKPANPLAVQVGRLRVENARLKDRLDKASKVIAVQGNLSALLEELLAESAQGKPQDEPEQ